MGYKITKQIGIDGRVIAVGEVINNDRLGMFLESQGVACRVGAQRDLEAVTSKPDVVEEKPKPIFKSKRKTNASKRK